MTVGKGLDFPTGVATDTAGNVYIADFNRNEVIKVPVGGGPQHTIPGDWFAPYGLAVSPSPLSGSGQGH
ncbi:SBBP repeat-containing protein [Streptomyces scopuliridis]|uniref:SBBP repeat-containing protein n=1 Tax=Streptomyces scopuliridis TaxID=452529 RepID=UPI00368D4ADD